MVLPEKIDILAGKVFDSFTKEFLTDRLITICPRRGIIIDIRHISSEEQITLLNTGQDDLIDLRQQTVLPGFVDAHVHFFLHPYTETSWEDQVTRESIVERTVRAVTHARKTLLAGFTTVRDLGTEGAGDADITIRKCLSGSSPIIPGPRYFCANRALVTTGSYGPKGVHNLNVEGVEGVTGAEVVDGKDECRKAVRRQIGAGADWIKIYGGNLSISSAHMFAYKYVLREDYSARSRMSDASSRIAFESLSTFHSDELEEIISTANALGVKTAIHLQEDVTALFVRNAKFVPHSIEHGSSLSEERLKDLQARDVYWVPTLAAYYSHRPATGGSQRWEQTMLTFQRALKIKGLKIACGGDTGVFPHGDNALELKLMVRLGADWKNVLQWATLGGWECVRGLQWEGKEGRERIDKIPQLQENATKTGDNDMPFGVIRKGFAADIIATDLSLDEDFEKAVDPTSISFVMKGGKVFKRDGKEISL